MFDRDKWQEIFHSISRNKFKAILTGFAVFWGIFILIVLLGAGTGLKHGVENMFRDDAVNSLWLFGGRTTKSYKGLKEGRRIRFTNSDYDLLNDEVEGVDLVTGRYWLSGDKTVVYKDKVLAFRMRAVHPNHQYIENTIVHTGRYINENDIREFRKNAVIGETVLNDLFPKGEDPIGKAISIGNVFYTVVGVFYDAGSEREMSMIYVPITTAQKIYSTTNDIHQLMVTIGDATLEESKVIEKRIVDKMAAKHQFDPNDERALYVRNISEKFAEVQSLLNGINMFVWVIGILCIMAGVIGISNIMLIIVQERTKEIGIRKALGATPVSIVSMIVAESMIITAIAGYIGMLAGIALVRFIDWALTAGEVDSPYFQNPEINLQVILSATILLIVAGAIAGLIPARKAAKINPIVAMRAD